MKRFAIVSGICATFLMGAALTVVAQDEHRDENNTTRQDRQDQSRPADRQDQARPADRQNEERPRQADEDRRNENRQSGDRHDTTPQGERHEEVQSGDRHDRPNGEHAAHRYERPQGREQRHIEDRDFQAHFGREHRFRPGRVEVIEGRPQFYYGGYTFMLADPWPAGWAYDSDDCYIDYVDGEYYLFNIRYPGMRVLVYIM